MAQTIGLESIYLGGKHGILGGQNEVTNPRFEVNTTPWAVDEGISTTIVSGGVQVVGDEYFYQALGRDVLNGTEYMARVLIESITGTWTMTAGNAKDDSSLGSITLAAGWNSFRMTASTVNVLSFKGASSSDTLKINVIEVREQVDLTVTGQIRNLDIEAGDVNFSNGTVSLPSIAFESDLDTGLYRIGANNLGVGVGGSKILDVASTGLTVAGTITGTLATAAQPNITSVGTLSSLTLSGALSGVTTGAFSGQVNTGKIVANSGAINTAMELISTDTTCQIYMSDDTTTEFSTLVRTGNDLSLIPGGAGTVSTGGGLTINSGYLTTTGAATTGTFSGYILKDGNGTINGRLVGDADSNSIQLWDGAAYMLKGDGSRNATFAKGVTMAGALSGVTTLGTSSTVTHTGNGELLNLRYAADGGSATIAWENSAGTTLWSMGGGISTAQDELAIMNDGTTTAFLIDSSNNVSIPAGGLSLTGGTITTNATSLPTSNPGAGILWNNGGVVTVGT